jgi:hypothetical protein
MSTIVIDPAFEGPASSAQGGYACGLIASHLPGDPEITLRAPVPLGTVLDLTPHDGGLALRDGAVVVAEGGTTTLADGVPEAPRFAEALVATAAFPGLRDHPYPNCVGCGTGRTDAVALRLFPGPVAGRDVVAAIWYPAGDGPVRPELVWAALDCPGGWAAAHFGRAGRPAVLGRMAARLVVPVPARGAYIVVGWLDGVAGRKITAGSALYSGAGVLHGFARQTWITLS